MNPQSTNSSDLNHSDTRGLKGDALLDQVIAGVRASEPEQEAVDAAASRVWNTLAAAAERAAPEQAALSTCEDYQALIPAYLAQTLPAAQALLFEDHTRECPRCRKALWVARGVIRPSEGMAGASTSTAAGAPFPFASPSPDHRGQQRSTAASASGGRPARSRRLVAVAAAVLAAVGLGGLALVPGLVPGFGGEVAHAQAVEGSLVAIGSSPAEGAMREVHPGDAIRAGQALRTSRGGRAVLVLADGSRVEMGERAGLVLKKGWRDTTLGLGQGSVIVESAASASGKLTVATDDLSVAGSDAIVAVSSGIKGSRVSVIEGQVQVDRDGGAEGLRPGQQLSSSPSVERVPVPDDVAWSQDAAKYTEILKELNALESEIAQLPRPGPRTSTVLLDRAPADTAIYLSLPNLSGTLQDARALAEKRIAESDVLQAWWRSGRGSEAQRELYPLLDRLTAVGQQLGPEIVVAMSLAPEAGSEASSDPATTRDEPEPKVLVLAEVKDEAVLRQMLAAEMDKLQIGDPDVHLLDAMSTAPASDAESAEDAAYYSIAHGLIAVGIDHQSVKDATLASPAPDASASDFRARLREAYAGGIDGLVAVNLAPLLKTARQASEAMTNDVTKAGAMASGSANDEDGLALLGLTNARYVVTTFKQNGEAFEHHTDIAFDGPRTGVAGWLAGPGPLGALGFLSPEASVVGAFTMQDPATLMRTILLGMDRAKAEATAMSGMDLVKGTDSKSSPGQDVADETEAAITAGLAELSQTLGGEVAFAMDGPLLPTPSWKLIAEVNQPEQFNAALGKLLAVFNDAAASAIKEAEAAGTNGVEDALGHLRISLAEVEPIAGRRAYALRVAGKEKTHDLAYYSFADGYLIMTPARGLIDAALRTKASGMTLEQSSRFKALLPTDANLNVSAVMYQNLSVLGDVPLADLAQRFARAHEADLRDLGADVGPEGAGLVKPSAGSEGMAAADKATEAEQRALSESLRRAPASLSYAYGAPDRIVIAGAIDRNPLGIGLAGLLGLGDPGQAMRLVEDIAH